jgi:hypothetical protein
MNGSAFYTQSSGDTIPPMGRLRWRLREFLDEHGLSAYALVKELDSVTRAPTIYRLAKEGVDVHKLDLGVAAIIMEALGKLTGKTVTPNDLLEFDPELN